MLATDYDTLFVANVSLLATAIFSSFAAAADPKKEEEKEKGHERKAKGAANKSNVKRRIKD